jgi:PAS domain S-box-containing protein
VGRRTIKKNVRKGPVSAKRSRPATRRKGKIHAQALHDSEQRLRAILQTAVEGIITIDERGIIESMNPAAERIFGWKAAEILGHNVRVLMPSPYQQEHDHYLENYRRTGEAKIIGIGREVIGLRKDGATFPMDLAVSEVRLAGRRLFTGFVRDITERKQAELRQAELTRILTEISDRERHRFGQDLHDGLCQQLAAIEFMSQTLQQKLASKSQPDAERVAEIAGYVREAIRQTRALAKGLSPVTLEVEGLMTALQELAANTQKLFGMDCRFECKTAIRLADLAVATHLYRIAQEAVSNAIKHGRAKQIWIQLQAAAGRAVLKIKDNGRGFSPDASPPAAGMGLHIMQYRAGMIGASLHFEHASGTTVVCSVPLGPVAADVRRRKDS